MNPKCGETWESDNDPNATIPGEVIIAVCSKECADEVVRLKTALFEAGSRSGTRNYLTEGLINLIL